MRRAVLRGEPAAAHPAVRHVGGAHPLLRLQQTAGNAAVSRAVSGPLPVQRLLKLTGAPPDVGKVLTLLQTASGLALHRNQRSKLVSTSGMASKPISRALTTHLGLILGDTTRVAKVKLARTDDEIFIGAFPENEKDRTQVVRIDQVLEVEQGVKGAGIASLAHELMENYEAQAVSTADWDDAFDAPHKTALIAENAILGELQDAAGATRSGDRLNTYQTVLKAQRGGRGVAGKRRTIHIETHERDYVLYTVVKVAGREKMTAARAPSTTLGTFTLTGFKRTSRGLPRGSLAAVQQVAALLDGDAIAGVVVGATGTTGAVPRAPHWTARVIKRIRDEMTGDAEATTSRRFGTRWPQSGVTNEVLITVRRPVLP